MRSNTVTAAIMAVALAGVLGGCDLVPKATAQRQYRVEEPFAALVVTGDTLEVTVRTGDGPVIVDNDVNWAARAERAAGAEVVDRLVDLGVAVHHEHARR